MNKKYEQPLLEVIFFGNLINMLDKCIIIDYPWGREE